MPAEEKSTGKNMSQDERIEKALGDLASGEEDRRKKAILELGEIGDLEHIPRLKTVREHDTSEAVRSLAALAMKKIARRVLEPEDSGRDAGGEEKKIHGKSEQRKVFSPESKTEKTVASESPAPEGISSRNRDFTRGEIETPEGTGFLIDRVSRPKTVLDRLANHYEASGSLIHAGAYKRVYAFSIDLILACIFGVIFYAVIIFLTETSRMVAGFLGVLAGCAFILVRDALFGGKSPGKRTAGLKVVNCSTMEIPDFSVLLSRQVPLLLPGYNIYELFYLLFEQQNMRTGDKLTDSAVVDEAGEEVGLAGLTLVIIFSFFFVFSVCFLGYQGWSLLTKGHLASASLLTAYRSTGGLFELVFPDTGWFLSGEANARWKFQRYSSLFSRILATLELEKENLSRKNEMLSMKELMERELKSRVLESGEVEILESKVAGRDSVTAIIQGIQGKNNAVTRLSIVRRAPSLFKLQFQTDSMVIYRLLEKEFYEIEEKMKIF